MRGTTHKFATRTGQLMVNLMAVESLLRIVLMKVRDEPEHRLISDTGDRVPRSTWTSWESLAALISEANKLPQFRDNPLPDLGKVRDVLVHARPLGLDNDEPPFAIKFTKPAKDDQFQSVEFCEQWTDQWFRDNLEETRVAMSRLVAVYNELNPQSPMEVIT